LNRDPHTPVGERCPQSSKHTVIPAPLASEAREWEFGRDPGHFNAQVRVNG